MSAPESNGPVTLETLSVQLEAANQRIDMLGGQMNWMVENLQQLFQFVTVMGSSGGGIRGLMHAMKNGGPDLTIPVDATSEEGKVESNDRR